MTKTVTMAKNNLLKELKPSFSNKEIVRVVGKDILFYVLVALIIFLYFTILAKAMPTQPGFTQETIFNVPTELIDQTTEQLKTFLVVFIIASIIAVLALIALVASFKEWIWTGILKKKCEWKNIPKFALISIVMYIVAGLAIFLMVMLTGLLFKGLIGADVSQRIVQVIAYLVMIIIIPAVNHLINFASYMYVKKGKLLPSLAGPFTSFSKTKELLLPYGIMMIFFIIAGLFTNLLAMISDNMVMSVISLLLFILFLSWQRVYAAGVFSRIYR